MKLGIIVGTVRQKRQTLKQAKWVFKAAQQLSDTEAELIDLSDYPMPFFDEPKSPRLNPERDIHPVAQRWLDKMAELDAYVFVTPEYNHSIPGVLKNSFDYFDWQILRKPAAIVSHGSAGGARAAMHLKEVISESRALPIQQHVAMTHMSDLIDDDGNLSPELAAQPYSPQPKLQAMLEELKWTSDALAAARTNSTT